MTRRPHTPSKTHTYRPLAIDPPPPPPPPPQLVSYSAFVHDQHPDIAGGDLKATKARRDGLKGAFTEPGAPG